jgi:hypothetical protein
MLKKLFTTAVIGLITCTACLAEDYQSQGVRFNVPLAFSQPSKAGFHAEQLSYPKQGELKMDILIYVAPAKERENLEAAGQSLSKYFCSTFLGITSQPLEVNKALIGDKGGRHLVYQSSIPSTCRADVFEIDRPDGSFVAISLRSYADVSDEQRIEISEALRKSLKF